MAGILTTLFVYARFFAYDSHAVSCVYVKAYAKPCPTCGITRAFYEILHLHFKKAYSLNKLAPWLFGFFFTQLITRLAINIILKKNKLGIDTVIKSDIGFSILLFLVCFNKLIVAIF